ncbi:hypothetical protein MMC09_005695 [Bachmanniomyces sp. S44760]|nr:hypothetical protein [Bachmanniomyces sp. S44760]
MLSSLPAIGPQSAHNLWYPSLATQPLPVSDPSSALNSTDPNHASRSQHQRSQRNNHNNHVNGTPRTILSILRADENNIILRKRNIQKFGAGWIRPLGVPKTLQGLSDERAEREEQEAVARRYESQTFGLSMSLFTRSRAYNIIPDHELAMLEAQAAAEAEAEAAGEMGEDGEGGDGVLDRDLDDDIPHAGDVDEEDDEDDEDEQGAEQEGWVDEDGDVDVDVTGDAGEFNLTTEGDGDYAEGGVNSSALESGASGLMAGMGLNSGEARDLDDDVPEAGSYQHTDTDVEDESSEDEGRMGMNMGRENVGRGGGGGGHGEGGRGSGILGSSVFGSLQGSQVQSAGVRRSGGFTRGRGREN